MYLHKCYKFLKVMPALKSIHNQILSMKNHFSWLITHGNFYKKKYSLGPLLYLSSHSISFILNFKTETLGYLSLCTSQLCNMNKIQEEIFEKERCEFELELRYKISWIILQEWIVLLFMVAWTIKFLNV